MFNNLNFVSWSRIKRVILAAICISLASQVSISTYTLGFTLTLSVFLLPVFLYFNADLNPLVIALGVALSSPLFRGLLLFISHDASNINILQFIMTDIAFYLMYGFLYYVLYWRKSQRNNSIFFLTILLCDYCSNLLEVSLLIHFSNYTYRLFQILFITALIRSLCSCLIIFLYRYFTLLVRDENHEQRYLYFIWVASSVKSEVYFMKKSINDIENVMKNAYQLNQALSQTSLDPKYQTTALNIARDVHEIKKDYQNVISGLGDYFSERNNQPMQLADILRVTTSYIRQSLKKKSHQIVIEVYNQIDLLVVNHYYVVSILSNLIFNSIDALQHQSHGLIKITVSDQDRNIEIDISDNGQGMDAQTLALIFEPGFTTKYNQNTGNVYRGIGLSHVKVLVEDIFAGSINVQSQVNQGTTFKVFLNKGRLINEVDK